MSATYVWSDQLSCSFIEVPIVRDPLARRLLIFVSTTMLLRSAKRKAENGPKDDGGPAPKKTAVHTPAGPSGDHVTDPCFVGYSKPHTREHQSVQELYGCNFTFDWHNTSTLPVFDKQKYQRFKRAKREGVFGGANILGIPSYGEIEMLLTSEAAAVRYLLEIGILQKPDIQCPKCGKTLDFKKKWLGTNLENEKELPRDCFNLRCGCKKKGGKSQSIFTGSILQDVKIPKNEWLHLLYLWLLDVPAGRAAEIVGVRKQTGKREM